jgi:hypothetical protein
MKWKVTLVFVLACSVSQSLMAQRGGGGGGGRRGGAGGYPGRRSGGSRSSRNGFPFRLGYDRYNNGNYNNGNNGGWAYPYYGDYWDPFGLWDDPAPGPPQAHGQPGQTMVPALPHFYSPPPPPPTPTIREYSWPDTGDGGSTFSIVRKNGTVERAIAVWTQDDRLWFRTPDGDTRSVQPSEVDRASTDRINAAQKLKLSIPSM